MPNSSRMLLVCVLLSSIETTSASREGDTGFPVYLREMTLFKLHEFHLWQGDPEFFIKCAAGKSQIQIPEVTETNKLYTWASQDRFITVLHSKGCEDCSLKEDDKLYAEKVATFSLCAADFTKNASQSIRLSREGEFEALFDCPTCAATTPLASLPSARRWRFVSTKGADFVEHDNHEGHKAEHLWDIEQMGAYADPSCQGEALQPAHIRLLGNDEGPWDSNDKDDPLAVPYIPHTERWFTYEPAWGGSRIELEFDSAVVIRCLMFRTYRGDEHRASRFPQEGILEWSIDPEGKIWNSAEKFKDIDQEYPVKMLMVDLPLAPSASTPSTAGIAPHHATEHCDIRYDMDLKGGTFKAAPISHIVATSDDDCIQRCTAQPECVAWVRQPSTGLCWMARQAGDIEFEEDSDRHCGLRCEFASVSGSPTSSPSSRTASSMTGAPTMSPYAHPTTRQPTTASSTGTLSIWSVMLLMGVVAIASAVSAIAGFKAYKRYKKVQKAAKQMEFTRLCDEEFKLDMAAVLVEDDAALANTTLIPIL